MPEGSRSAAEEGLKEVKPGAHLEIRDEHGLTALLLAAIYDRLKVVEALVEAGDSWMPAMWMAEQPSWLLQVLATCRWSRSW